MSHLKKNVLRNSSKTSYYYNSWRKKKKVTAIIYDETFLFKKSEFK